MKTLAYNKNVSSYSDFNKQTILSPTFCLPCVAKSEESAKQTIQCFWGKILPQVKENLSVFLSSGNRFFSIVHKVGFHLYISVSHCGYNNNSKST